MGRYIPVVRWALAPAIVVGLALAPQALAGGLTDAAPVSVGQLAAPVSAIQDTVVTNSAVVQGSVETAETAAAAAPAVPEVVAAVAEPVQARVGEIAAGAVRAAPPAAVVERVGQVVAAPAGVPSVPAVAVPVRRAPVAAAKPAVKRLSAAPQQLSAAPQLRRAQPRQHRVRPTQPSPARVQHVARPRVKARSAAVGRTTALVPLAPLAGPADPAPAAPGAGGATPVALAPEPVLTPAIGGRTPLTTSALLFRSLTLVLRLERPD